MQRLTEAPDRALTEAPREDGRLPVQIITAGVGSSGYYSPDVLREAAEQRLVTRGTPLFLDHASESERRDRPERSVRDIAAVFTGDATYDPDTQALVGEAQVFSPYRSLLTEMGPYIGLSISGSATDVTEGEVDGRTVPVIEGLAVIDSVDFVTRAGRGGRVLELAEAARAAVAPDTARLQLAEARNVGQWIESRLHLELTMIADNMYGDGHLTREERVTLSSAVGAALDTFTATLQDAAPALYRRDLWDEPEAILAAEESRTPNVPATRSDGTTTQEDTMPQIEEARLRELEEAHGRVPTLETERDTALAERDQAREELAVERRTAEARRIIGEAETPFTALEQRGLMADLPLTEAGDLDVEQFRSRVTEAAEEAATRHDGATVRGFGQPVGNGGSTLSESDLDAAIGGAFGRIMKEA